MSYCTKRLDEPVPRIMASASFGYAYGNRYSTPVNPAFAAASRRSRKSISFHSIVRLAESLIIGLGLPQGRPKGGLRPLWGVTRGIRGAPLRARDTGRLRNA